MYIATINKNLPEKILQPITGEFSPGYLYGTVKIHKPINPLRPIISKISTTVYTTEKQLNTILSEYLRANIKLTQLMNSYKF